MDRPWRAAWVALGLAGATLFVVLQFTWLREPFGYSIAGDVEGAHIAYAARGFERHGFLRMRMTMPYFWHPAGPEAAIPYLNYPWLDLALATGSRRLFGRDEAALRLPFLLGLIGALAAFARCLGSARGPAAAGLGTALLVTLPGVLLYGSNVSNFAGLGLASLVLGYAAWRFWRRHPTRRRLIVWSVVALLLSQSEWVAYGLVPALGLDILLDRQRPAHPWRSMLFAAAPFGVGLLALAGWMTWSLGSPSAVVEHWCALFGRQTHGRDPSFWFGRMGGYLLEAFHVALVPAATGFLVAVRNCIGRRPPDLDRLALVLTFAGLVPVLAFREHSAVNPFFVTCLGAGIAALGLRGILALAALAARLPGAARGAALVTVLLVLGVAVLDLRAGLDLHERGQDPRRQELARVLDENFGPDDLVIYSGFPGAALYYTHVPLAQLIYTPEHLARVVEVMRPVADRVGRVFYAVEGQDAERYGAALIEGLGPLLPRIPGTDRRIEVPKDYLLVTELDKARLFRR